jgi:hypothetical protein
MNKMTPLTATTTVGWALASFFGAAFLYRRYLYFRQIDGVWMLFGVFALSVLIENVLGLFIDVCASYDDVFSYVGLVLLGITTCLYILQVFKLAIDVSEEQETKSPQKKKSKKKKKS